MLYFFLQHGEIFVNVYQFLGFLLVKNKAVWLTITFSFLKIFIMYLQLFYFTYGLIEIIFLNTLTKCIQFFNDFDYVYNIWINQLLLLKCI